MKRFLYVLVIFIFAKYGFSNENFEYSMKMHEAFVLQSLGKSTAAFYSFQNGYMQAIKAGEHPLRLEAILGQFMWYRRFGSYTKLFAREPTGNDVISDQYQEESFFSNSENITNFEERLWAMTQAMLTTPCNFSDFPTTHHRKSNQSSFFFPVAFI